MENPRFESIPAWRVARLRAQLRAAERRGADFGDDGLDLLQRALRRRFSLGRHRVQGALKSGPKLKTTRKGRAFPLAKQMAIWRAILAFRTPSWQQGDTAPFGSIRRAHHLAAASCRAAGLAPPRYRTIYVLWHRGVPSADVRARLESERQPAL